jgi:hypothetical protein
VGREKGRGRKKVVRFWGEVCSIASGGMDAAAKFHSLNLSDRDTIPLRHPVCNLYVHNISVGVYVIRLTDSSVSAPF